MAYRIEFREYNIAGFGGHYFFVMYNDTGLRVGELHGLATNRVTGLPVAVGTNADQLRGWIYPLQNGTYSGLYQAGQSSQTVFQGTAAEATARWNAGSVAALQITNNNVTYDLMGGPGAGLSMGNSNSVANTLGAVMGVETPNLSWWTFNPGDGKNLLPKEAYPNLYVPGATASPVSSSDVYDTNSDGTIDKQVYRYANGDDVTVVDNNFDGQADTRTERLDLNADTIIDRISVRTDADHNGVAESTSLSVRGADNICRREDYAVSPVGLPSTTSYTFRAGFDSELNSKEVVSTAGNGLVSKVLSEFDAQSHITVANSVLAANADLSGRTTIAQQANGTWVQDAWHYNAAGSATGHELSHLRANQSMADITAYDALGQADVSTAFALDGSSVVYDYDQANQTPLSYTQTTIDTLGRIDTITAVNRLGGYTYTDYGLAASDPLLYTQIVVDAQNRTDTVIAVNDAGGYTYTDYGLETGDPLLYTQIVVDAQNRIDTVTIVKDAGGYTYTDFGLAASDPLLYTQTVVDAQNRIDTVTTVKDAGGYTYTDYGLAASDPLLYTQTVVDAQNRIDTVTTVYDVGGYTFTDLDQANANATVAWTSTTYAANGSRDNQTVYNDNKTSTIYDWDLTGMYQWQSSTTNYDATGRQTNRSTLADVGAVAQNWLWKEWDVSVADYGNVPYSSQVQDYISQTYTETRIVPRSQIVDFDDFGFPIYDIVDVLETYPATRLVPNGFHTVTETRYEITGYHLEHHADWVLV
jgi:hypothetical protein